MKYKLGDLVRVTNKYPILGGNECVSTWELEHIKEGMIGRIVNIKFGTVPYEVKFNKIVASPLRHLCFREGELSPVKKRIFIFD